MSVAAIETRRSILLTGWCVLAAIVLALVIAVGVSVGELAIPLQNVFYAISNRTGLTAEPLNRIYESVIWDFRLSRALVAACCGAGLAICGVVLQSLLKNALAEPYVLGVSAGASTGAVSIVVLGLGAGAISLSAGAFAGAFAAFAFVARAAAMSVRFWRALPRHSYLTPSRLTPSAPPPARSRRAM